MSWIKTGTTSQTNGSPIVTGSGTSWVDVGTLNPGDMYSAPDGKFYEILSFQSNTGLTLTSNYLGTTASGSAYAIIPIGLLPSALAQQVKAVLTTANTALASAVLSTSAQGLTSTQQGNARANIAALGAADVGAGRLSKSVAGGVDVTLTAAEAANQFFEFTGTLTGNINVIYPAAVRFLGVYNNTSGAFTLTPKTAAGSGVPVTQGGRTLLECDATNVVNPLSYLKSSGVTEDALGNLGLGVIPSAFSGKAIQVTNASLSSYNGQDARICQNMYFDGANYRYITANPASMMMQYQNTYSWWFSSGTPAAGGIVTQAQEMILDASGNLTPGTNGTQAFGSTSMRWSQVWCTAGAFNTSDARLKTPVTLLSVVEKQAAAQFSREIGTFQWLESIKDKGAENARHHVGITVQRAQEILESFGLNPWRYGFMSYDKWDDEFVEHPAIEASDAVTEQRENSDTRLMEIVVITPSVQAKAAWTEQTKKAGDAYAFRYDQLNMFIAAGIEYRLTALEAK